MARTRKLAISPRITGRVGQNFEGSQPVVIAAAARRLMSVSWVVPSSSVK
jgi:hypothetical protein